MPIKEATLSAIILEILSEEQIELSTEYKKRLQDKRWLCINDQCISPQNVLTIAPKDLRSHLGQIVELSAGEFIADSALPSAVKSCLSKLRLMRVFDAADIIRFVLSKPHPHLYAHIICDALQILYKDQKLGSDILQRIRAVDWLIDKFNNPITPLSVIHYPSIKEEVEEILAFDTEKSYISSSQLSPTISKHDCFQWLSEQDNFFIKDQRAIKLVGELLEPLSHYWLGAFSEEVHLEGFFKVFKDASTEVLPVWAIASKLGKPNFRKFILPNLLQNPDATRLLLIMQYISSSVPSPDAQTVELYNQYLELAVHYDNFQSDILPNLKLLSEENKWQEPGQLCWEEGHISTVSTEAVLHERQRAILNDFLDGLFSHSAPNSDVAEADQDETNEEILRNYFASWESLISNEFIGAFLSLITGENESLEALAQGYLGNRNINLIRNRLLGSEQELPVKHFRICLARRDDCSQYVCSVLGTYFRANLKSTRVGFDLFSIRKQTDDLIELELFPFEAKTVQVSLNDLLFKGTRRIVRKIYKVETLSLQETWNDLIKSKQLDIQVARSFILEGAPYVLRSLGIHKNNSTVNSLLREWDEKRHIRADLKHQNQSTDEIERQIEQIIQQLSDLFESDDSHGQELRYSSLTAVRRKIEEFGYYPNSIPFELFQNADDAVLELERIAQDQLLEEDRKRFILNWHDRQLTFIHWGRPINLSWSSNNFEEDYRKEGFDRDLEKMLTFNISDKASGATGKFGLGFKSIHLACNHSQIVSRDLAFTVLGGLLPLRLPAITRSNLQQELKAFSDLADGTLIKLFVDPDVNVSARGIVANFHALAGLLLVFAKRIRQCEIRSQYQTISLSWSPKDVLAMPEVETGEIQLRDNLESSKWSKHRVLCFRTGEPDYASVVLGFSINKDQLVASLPKELPTFWVTAPTCKRLNLGFVLNANFDVTTGRESLVEFSKHNAELADRIGERLGYVLTELFRRSETNWQEFLQDLNLPTLDRYTFWNFIWQEFAVRWLWQQESSGILQIIRRVFAGSQGMGYFVNHAPCLPSGLWGEYRQLVLLKNVKYEIKGVLAASQATFLKVAQWSKFRENCYQNLVSEKVWSDLKLLLRHDFAVHQSAATGLKLIDVLQWEMGRSDPFANPDKASQLGRLITRQFIHELENEAERQEVKIFLQQTHFSSGDNVRRLPAELIAVGEDSDEEEKRLAAFAPLSALLKSSYADSALAFFFACRERRATVVIDILVEWALQAEGQQQEAVRNYLREGDRKDDLAMNLARKADGTWLEKDEWTREWLAIAEYRENLKHPDSSPLPTSNDSPTPQFLDDRDPWDENPIMDDEEFSKPRFTGRTTASSDREFEEFSKELLEGLASQSSAWKGYIYHFTHVENAASILRDQRLLSRSACNKKFMDSAGKSLIAHTGSDVLSFARFYFRPLTPTQWHNELLGRRQGDIYALCPVPIFLRFNLSSVLKTHGRNCMVSDGNLAASSTQYGNSVEFIKQCFDFENVFGEVRGKGAVFRASQQEFIVNQHLDLSALSQGDITVICRNSQDKKVLVNLLGSSSFYHSRIFTVDELSFPVHFYHNENAHVRVSEEDGYAVVQIEKYSERISGNLFINLNQEPGIVKEIAPQIGSITKVRLDQTIGVAATQGLRFQCDSTSRFAVYFQEEGKNWLIYTNESTDS